MATDRRRDAATVLTGAGLVAAGGGARHAGVTRALTDRLGKEPGAADYPRVHALALKGARRRPKALYLGGTALGLAGAAGMGTGTVNLLQRKDVGKREDSLLREGLAGNLEALKGRKESLASGAPPSARGTQLAVAGGAGLGGSALARLALKGKATGRQKALVAPIGAALAATASLPVSGKVVQARTRGQYVVTPTGVKRAKASIVRPSSQARVVDSRHGPLRDQVVPSDVRKGWMVLRADRAEGDQWFRAKSAQTAERRFRREEEMRAASMADDGFDLTGMDYVDGPAPWQKKGRKKPVRKSDYLGRRTPGVTQRAAIMGAGATPLVGPLVQARVSGGFAPPGQERKHAVRQWAMGPGAGAVAGIGASYAAASRINRNPTGATARAAQSTLDLKDRAVSGAKRKVGIKPRPEGATPGRVARAQSALKTKAAPHTSRVMSTRAMRPFKGPGKVGALAALATVKPLTGFVGGQHAMTLNQRDQRAYNRAHPVKKADPGGRGQSKREKHQLADTKRLNAALSMIGGTAGVTGLGLLAASRGRPRLRGAAYGVSTVGTGVGGANALIHARVQRREAEAIDPVKKVFNPGRLHNFNMVDLPPSKRQLTFIAGGGKKKTALKNPRWRTQEQLIADHARPMNKPLKENGMPVRTQLRSVHPRQAYGGINVGKAAPRLSRGLIDNGRSLQQAGMERSAVGTYFRQAFRDVPRARYKKDGTITARHAKPSRAGAYFDATMIYGRPPAAVQTGAAALMLSGKVAEKAGFRLLRAKPLSERVGKGLPSHVIFRGKRVRVLEDHGGGKMTVLGDGDTRQITHVDQVTFPRPKRAPSAGKQLRLPFGKADGNDHKKLLRDYGDRGPLPKKLDRETRMRAYEARYAAHGGHKGEKWKRRADVAEGVRNVGLAGATAGGALWLASRTKRVGPKIAHRVSPRVKHHADTVAVGSATLGGAAELYGEYARNRRASYASSPGGVAASALTRMRANTPEAKR